MLFLFQSKLLRCLDRIKIANFSRVQAATTINRVVESIRYFVMTSFDVITF